MHHHLFDNAFKLCFFGGIGLFKVLTAICGFASFVCCATTLEVFYDTTSGEVEKQQLSDVTITYYQLDRSQILQSEIDNELPSEINKAAAYMVDFNNSANGKAKIKEIVTSYQGVGRAFSLGVKFVPAVVINGRFVVYGKTDAADVLDIWKKYEKENSRD